MYLWIVRHGRCEPGADGPLSASGEQEAQRTAERLQGEGITQILSSPLLRALDTATIIGRALGRGAVEVWPELREGFSGQHRGPGAAQLLTRYPGLVLPAGFAANGWDHGADTYEGMLARCRQTLDRLLATFTADARVLLVTHGGFGNHLLHVLLAIPPAAPAWFEMDYCAISRLRLVPLAQQTGWPLYPPVAVEVLALNDVSHLPGGAQESSRV